MNLDKNVIGASAVGFLIGTGTLWVFGKMVDGVNSLLEKRKETKKSKSDKAA